MRPSEVKNRILSGKYDERLTFLYGEAALEMQKKRYAGAIDEFVGRYGENREIELFSVSGRSEISGNHTDHNHGKMPCSERDTVWSFACGRWER